MQEFKKEKAVHKMGCKKERKRKHGTRWDVRCKERENRAQDGMHEVKKEQAGHKMGCKK